MAATPATAYGTLAERFPDFDLKPPDVIAARATSFWDPSPARGACLFKPTATDEVSRFMRHCHEERLPVVIQGGRTGCAGGAVAGDGQIILSLEAMTEIEEIDETGRTVTVQAGCILQTVQEAVAEKGFLLPLDLGARGSCTIGGNVATNAGGINVLRYGMVRAHVLGLEAVLPDGTVLSSLNRMLKNNSGYDLKQLFIGSEGTLGIVTRVVLRLEEAQPHRDTALVALDRFDAVPLFLRHMQRHLGGGLTAFEAMWGDYYDAVTLPGHGHAAPMARGAPYYVLLDSTGNADNTETMNGGILTDALAAALDDGLITDAVIAKSARETENLWIVRENFEAITAQTPCFLYDVSLPMQHMDTYVTAVQRQVRQKWPANRGQEGQCHVLGHVADGNLHLFICPFTDGPDAKPVADRIVYETLTPYGGAVSAEHGIGHDKKDWLGITRNETEVALMRRLKRTIDPRGILNPGLIFDMTGQD